MIVVDSSAVVTIINRKPGASLFNEIIANAEAIFLSAMSLLETSMVLSRSGQIGLAWRDLDELIERLQIVVVPFDAIQVEAARNAFLRYGKGRHPAALDMGDCASYALAKSRNLPILFKGNDFTRTDLIAAA